MIGRITKLKDNNDNYVVPITSSKAVYVDENNTLDSKILDIESTLSSHTENVANTLLPGHVQLSTSVSSTSESLAATASAVKTAYDLAYAAIPASQKGVANGVAILDSDGKVASMQLPSMQSVDNGRYQSEYNFEDSFFSEGIKIDNANKIYMSSLESFPIEVPTASGGGNWHDSTTTITDFSGLEFTSYQDATGISFKFKQGFSANSQTIVELRANDKTTVLASSNFNNFFNYIVGTLYTLDVNIYKNNIYYIGVKNATNIGYLDTDDDGFPLMINNDLKVNANIVNNNISGGNRVFLIDYLQLNGKYTLNGTCEKILSPSNITKWGNLKFDKITPLNTNIICDILKNDSSIHDFPYYSSTTIFNNNYGGFRLKPKENLNKMKLTIATPVKIIQIKKAIDNSIVKIISGNFVGNQKIEIFVDLDKNIEYYIEGSYLTTYNHKYALSSSSTLASTYADILGGRLNNSNNTNIYIFSSIEIFPNIVLKSSVQLLQDLSDIDITQYPSLKVKWKLTKNNASDISPTVSNPSVTWEGAIEKGIQIANGSWSDNTTNVPANNVYIKSIPLPFSAKSGKLSIMGYSPSSSIYQWAIINFTTVKEEAMALWSDISNIRMNSGTKMNFSPYSLIGAILDPNGCIYLKSVCILENTLQLEFYNGTPAPRPISIYELNWEVIG